jgi:hypothetical protein
MVRLTVPTAGALLALASIVYAKKKNGIWVYPFVTEVCLGNPIGAPLYIETGNCMETQANSVKPMVHVVRNWIDATNNQEMECALATYKTRACSTGDEIEFAPLPRMLSQCVMSLEPFTPILSVKFLCYKKDASKGVGIVTRWTIGNDFRPTPHVSTMFATLKARATPTAIAAEAPATLAEREFIIEDDDGRPIHIKREDDPNRDVLSVWMLHPWSKTMLCYLCYTAQKKDFNDFRCTSGPHHIGHCGPPPPSINGEPIPVETKIPLIPVDPLPTEPAAPPIPVETLPPWGPTMPSQPITTPQPPASSSPPHAMSSQPKPSSPYKPKQSSSYKPKESPKPKPAYTLSVQLYKPKEPSKLSPSEGRLSKRASWHKPVFFISPFVPGLLMCGFAEWEKRGQPNSEIRIRHMGPCGIHIEHGENIGIPV